MRPDGSYSEAAPAVSVMGLSGWGSGVVVVDVEVVVVLVVVDEEPFDDDEEPFEEDEPLEDELEDELFEGEADAGGVAGVFAEGVAPGELPAGAGTLDGATLGGVGGVTAW